MSLLLESKEQLAFLLAAIKVNLSTQQEVVTVGRADLNVLKAHSCSPVQGGLERPRGFPLATEAP
jgi:hypothetical protein